MDLKGFFKQNVKQVEAEDVVISTRFLDDKGLPIKWKIRPINNAEDDKLRNDATVQVKVKKGVYTPQFNHTQYIKSLIIKCVEYPNLNNKELQDSYGVLSAEELLDVFLLPGEYNTLATEVTAICGFDADKLEEKIDEAKN